MKCEICHKEEATEAISVEKDDVSTELYVCKTCAEAHKHPRKPKKAQGHQDANSMPDISSDQEPPEFVKDFVEATLGLMQGMAQDRKKRRTRCPACGMTWKKVEDSGRLGCPMCWRAFANDLRKEFLRGQYSDSHKGSPPPEVAVHPEDVVTVLERKLKEAVAREDFHVAADIKRKLDAMRADPPKGEA